jgi:hypothetical protein
MGEVVLWGLLFVGVREGKRCRRGRKIVGRRMWVFGILGGGVRGVMQGLRSALRG